MMNGMDWCGMWFGWIFWLVILGLIIWGVVTIVNNSRRHDEQNNLPPTENALGVLKKRYARGEINREQYEQMKRDLS